MRIFSRRVLDVVARGVGSLDKARERAKATNDQMPLVTVGESTRGFRICIRSLSEVEGIIVTR